MTNKNSLEVDKKEQRSVSICEERMVIEHTKARLDVDRKESSASFLNPALSFARRMSLKITGSRGESRDINIKLHQFFQTVVMSTAELVEPPGILPIGTVFTAQVSVPEPILVFTWSMGSSWTKRMTG